MKTVVQIVLAIVVLVACARGGEATWRYYQLKDAVEQEMRFGGAKTTSQLHRRVMELAAEHDVALEYEDVTVESVDNQTRVSVSYIEAISLVPALYTRDQAFEFDVRVHAVKALADDER